MSAALPRSRARLRPAHSRAGALRAPFLFRLSPARAGAPLTKEQLL